LPVVLFFSFFFSFFFFFQFFCPAVPLFSSLTFFSYALKKRPEREREHTHEEDSHYSSHRK